MNRLFKKTLSLMLVIVMTVSLGVSAAAADQTGAAQAEGPLGIVSAMSVELNALVAAGAWPLVPRVSCNNSNQLLTFGPMIIWNWSLCSCAPNTPGSCLISSCAILLSSTKSKRSRVIQCQTLLIFSGPPTRRIILLIASCVPITAPAISSLFSLCRCMVNKPINKNKPIKYDDNHN